MPKLTYVPDNKTVPLVVGDRIIDVCRQHDLNVAFGCEIGSCGTCLSRVTRGAHALSKPSEDRKKCLAYSHKKKTHDFCVNARLRKILTLR